MSNEVRERPKDLPAEFQDLAVWEDWILWIEEDRIQKRLDSTIEEVGEFFDAVVPRLEDLFRYFAGLQPDELDDRQLALFCLATSFVEIADTVEYYSPDSTAPEAMPRFRPAHGLFGLPDQSRRVRFIA